LGVSNQPASQFFGYPNVFECVDLSIQSKKDINIGSLQLTPTYLMKKILTLTSAFCLAASFANAQTVVQFNFDGAADQTIDNLSADVGTGTWDNALTNVATNGSGALVNGGSTPGGSSGSGTNLDITDLTSGIYEFVASEVVFNGIGGGSDDTIGFGFRTNASGNPIGGSGFDLIGINVGNINSSGTLDATLHISGAIDQTVNDFAATAGTYSFIAQYNLGADTASFFYDSGSGRNQIGTTISGITANATHLGFSSTVVDFGGGDNVEVGGLTLTQVPESSAYALIAGLLSLSWIMVRRRK